MFMIFFYLDFFISLQHDLFNQDKIHFVYNNRHCVVTEDDIFSFPIQNFSASGIRMDPSAC